MPPVDNHNPINPAIIAFTKDPSERFPMVIKPSVINPRYSKGPKFKAIFDIGGASVARKNNPISPPINEPIRASPRAIAALPCFARGYPSNPVHIEEGAPGIFKRTAEIDPPKTPPAYTPIIIASAYSIDHPKVNETSNAVAIVTDKPGNAPISTPDKLPKAVSSITLISSALVSASTNINMPPYEIHND